MDRFRSWIDRQRLQVLVAQTAWSPSRDKASSQPDVERTRSRFAADAPPPPPSKRETEQAIDAPVRSFSPPAPDERRSRGWTEYLDDDPRFEEPRRPEPPYFPERTEPRLRPRLRVEPPPEPRPSFDVASVEREVEEHPYRAETPTIRIERASRSRPRPAEPRLERRSPMRNRDVEPPPEPVVPAPAQPSLPPPPTFIPGYQPLRTASLEEKLAHLLDWAATVSGLDVAFVADHEGLLLARRQATDVEEAVAAVLEGFLEQLAPFLGEALEGHVTLRSHGRVFVVTWHETEAGRFFLGIVGGSTPPPSVVPELASALAATVAEVAGEEPPPMGRPAPLAETVEPSSPVPDAPAPTRAEPSADLDPMPAEPPPPPTVDGPARRPTLDGPARRPTVDGPAPRPTLDEAGPRATVDGPAPPRARRAAPADAAPPPPPEVPPASEREQHLERLRARATEPYTALLRVALQTGLPVERLQQPDALTDAEFTAVKRSAERIAPRK